MRKDGICMVSNDYYTKTLRFDDINYELAGDEEQEAIFNRYCRFLNQFESNIDIQFTFQNKVIDMKEFKKYIKLPDKKGESEKIKEYRQEYQEMLYNQLLLLSLRHLCLLPHRKYLLQMQHITDLILFQTVCLHWTETI